MEYIATALILYSSALISQSPVAYYRMDGNANDASGNSLNGTANGVTLTTDRFENANSAYQFDGNDWIDITYAPQFNIDPTGQFTIMAWLLPVSLVDYASAVFVKAEYQSSYFSAQWDYGLYLVNSTMNGMGGGGGGSWYVQGTTPLANSTCWRHLAVTYNNGAWNLYVDGALEASANSGKITQSTSALALGTKGQSSGDHYKGKMDDVAFYNVALTPAEIDTIYQNGKITSLIATHSDTTICRGSSVQLQAAGNGASTYQWFPATGLSNTAIVNPVASPTVTTDYIVNTSSTQCPATSTVTIIVIPLPLKPFGADTGFCEGVQVVLDAQNTGDSYLWSSGSITQQISVNQSGAYTVQITNANCSLTFSINVSSTAMPNDPFGADTMLCSGETIVLDAGNSGASYQWNNGNTTRQITITKAGTYDVLVSKSICSITAQIVATENNCNIGVYIPCSFTPGGDNVNDLFYVFTAGELKTFDLKIYDRWGKLIFKTTDINVGWDGRYNGSELHEDVYVYNLNYAGQDNVSKKLLGRIALLK